MSESLLSGSSDENYEFEDLEDFDEVLDRTKETVEDAWSHIVDQGGFVEIATSNILRLHVPVPSQLLHVFSSSSDSFPNTVPFLLRLSDLKIVLEPFWDGDRTPVEKCDLAIGKVITCMPDMAPFCNLKPLLISLNNDAEMVRIMIDHPYNNRRPSPEAVAEVATKATSRVSLLRENFEGVFRVDDGMCSEKMPQQIIRSALEMWSTFQTRNVVRCVFQTVRYNLENFGKRCYMCGAMHQHGDSYAEPTTCCNDLCR